MAHFSIISWRNIPAQIIVRTGRSAAKRELPLRFQEAIDRAAMAFGAKDSDAYLAEWKRSAPQECGEDLEAEADRLAAELEAAYSSTRLHALAQAGGHETPA